MYIFVIEEKLFHFLTFCSISCCKTLATVKNGVKKIQAAAYNGAPTVYRVSLLRDVVVVPEKKSKKNATITTI